MYVVNLTLGFYQYSQYLLRLMSGRTIYFAKIKHCITTLPDNVLGFSMLKAYLEVYPDYLPALEKMQSAYERFLTPSERKALKKYRDKIQEEIDWAFPDFTEENHSEHSDAKEDSFDIQKDRDMLPPIDDC